MQSEQISPKSQVLDISDLASQNDDSTLCSIRKVVETTLDRATERFGLQELAKLGVAEEELVEMARAYDKRISKHTPLGNPFSFPLLYMEYFVLPTTKGYKIVDLEPPK